MISKIKSQLEIKEEFNVLEMTIKSKIISYKINNQQWRFRNLDEEDEADLFSELNMKVEEAEIIITKQLIHGYYINDEKVKVNFKF